MKYFLNLLFFILFIPSAFALVDYSESVPAPEEKNTSKSYQKLDLSQKKSTSNRRSLAWKSDLSFTSHYESLEISGEKYGVLKLNTHIQTPANVFVNASYWHAQVGGENSNGNPKLIVGFNWLKIGAPSEEAKFDIFGGMKFSSKSLLGTGRTDKIVGLETTKRFGTMGLGIGYNMTMVGEAAGSEERAIGNINHIVMSGAWMVSEDIQFELELDNYTIAEGKNKGQSKRLEEKVTFSTFSPKLNLGLAPAVNLEMGARYRIKKAKESSKLLEARVFDLNGANSNSLFAGLNITI